MASAGKTKRRDSKEQPPNMENTELLYIQTKDLIKLVDETPDLQTQIDKLKEITDRVENIHKLATAGSLTGGVVAAAGGIAAVAGFALAPITFGASLVVAQVGTAVAAAGGLTSATSNIANAIHQKVSRGDIDKALKTFKDKLSPISGRLVDIDLSIQSMSGLFNAASGLSVLDMLDDICAMTARQISKNLKVIAGLSGVFSGLTVVLNIFFVVRDVQELNRIKKGRTDSSETLQFIEKMKETINALQEVVDNIKDTKKSLELLLAKLSTLILFKSMQELLELLGIEKD